MQPSKPRAEAPKQPPAAAASGEASARADKGSLAIMNAQSAEQPARHEQSLAVSGAPTSQGLASAKQSATLVGTSMTQAHAPVHNADRPLQQTLASPLTATNLTGSAARQDSLGTGSEDGKGKDSRRVEAVSKEQRRKRHREDVQQAAVAAPAPHAQQKLEAQGKRARIHPEQATARVLAAAKVGLTF